MLWYPWKYKDKDKDKDKDNRNDRDDNVEMRMGKRGKVWATDSLIRRLNNVHSDAHNGSQWALQQCTAAHTLPPHTALCKVIVKSFV